MTTIRAVEELDLPVLDAEHDSAELAGEFSWFGFGLSGRMAKRFAAGEMFTDNTGNLAIADDEGQAVGGVSWRKTLNGPPPFGECWNIGIWVHPDHRGHGHGSEAQRQLAAYLFAHTKCERVEASTEADNRAEQRALEKAGFTREGVLRRACFRAGAWRDMVLFSKLRGES